MGKEGYLSAQRLMVQRSKRDMEIAISNVQGLAYEMDVLSSGSIREKILNLRRKRAASSAFKTAVQDVGNIAFTQDLVSDIDKLQYFKGCTRDLETTHIKGMVNGCLVDVIRRKDNDIDRVEGRVGRVDVARRPELGYIIFDTYGPLLEERDKLARALTR